MDAQRIQVKLYASARGDAGEAVLKVFHDFIRRGALDELLIDVADYRHVHHGPGVVLIGHAANYSLDLGEGRPGLLYTRKRLHVPPPERLVDALRRALEACTLLEREPALAGALAFATDELLLRFPDRLRAPDPPESHAAIRHELEAVLGQLFESCRVERAGAAGDPVGYRVRAANVAPSVEVLLDRVAAVRAA